MNPRPSSADLPPPVPAAAGIGAAAATSVGADLRHMLRDGHFRLLLGANFACTVGDWLAFMALFSLTSYTWNKGVTGVSLLGIAYMLPIATLAPAAGVWVDRWELRRVLVTSALLRAGILLLMALWPRFWATCLLLFVHQTMSCFFNPAQHSALARLVRREHLLVANALNTQATQLTKILGPGIAGLLVAWLGPRGCFEFDALMLALAGLLLGRLPRLTGAGRGETTFAREFRTGLQFLAHAVRLRAVLFLLMLSLSALGGFIAILPVFARDQLGVGPRGMGFLLSAMGAGAALGAFVVAHAGKRWDKIWSITAGACIAALALAVVAATARTSVALLGTTLLGWGVVFLLVPAYALLQEETPRALLGRVVSLAIAGLSLAQVVGMGVAGGAATGLTPHTLLQGEAILLAAAAFAFLLWTWRRQPGPGRDTWGLPSR